jgi:hypothetical protein
MVGHDEYLHCRSSYTCLSSFSLARECIHALTKDFTKELQKKMTYNEGVNQYNVNWRALVLEQSFSLR